jgi:predicted TIM-barrel fold metal-dependent hydrolase
MSANYTFQGNAYRKIEPMQEWTNQRHESALEPALAIIDPHHHVWDDSRGRYLMHELAADTNSGHNIVATVYIEAGSMYRADTSETMSPVGEIEFANGIAAMSASGAFGNTRHCAGIIGHADLMLGHQVKPVLEAMIAAGNGRFRGIRHSVVWDTGNAARFGRRQSPRHQLLDPTYRQGFAQLQPLGLSFEAWLFHPQLSELANLLEAFPQTNVILNHVGGLLGIPPHDGNRDEVFAIWKNNLQQLAKFPNLTVKVGGLGMLYCGWDFHLRDLPPTSLDLAQAWKPYVEACIEIFGVDRCMMESNFPVDKQSCGYEILWNALKRITTHYSEQEKKSLYHDTAARVYRINI